MDDTPTPFQPFQPAQAAVPTPEAHGFPPVEPPKHRRKRRTKAEIEAARLSAGKKRRPYVRRQPVHTVNPDPIPVVSRAAVNTDSTWELLGKIVASLRSVHPEHARQIVQDLGKLFP